MVGKNFKALAHFHRLTEYIVQCKHCDKTLSSKHTSSNLTRHLIRNHKLLARTIFAGEGGKMLAELKDELEASASEDLSMELGEGETKSAVRGIMSTKLEQEQMERHSQEEMRNKVIGKNNKLWAHFIRISEFMAKCMHCGKTLSSKHSSSNLMRHIVRRHTSLAKTLNHSHQHLTTPKKESYASLERRQAADPLEKVNFDDVDSIIEKVADHLEEEVTSISLQEPFYEYVVDNSDSVVVDRCEEPEPAEMQNMIPPDSASLAESTTQLDEKLKAETIYYNEMAELARAKRRLIDLQTKKLLLDMNVVDH
ncbi:uncharacterized protein LOC6612762 isoform X1 [Drosophila sechellia]|uniref:GD17609 n=2 Tax=melanogaster subgroup TaxID=32351 RepID=B4R0U5_DROSI|nr:uncharacterized protein LOC6612762 isoform X1 [Drosophila sechellia]XP_002105413.1 uncharacterized protein LOC6730120 isoform X1 [Drosophila simulans]EDW53424.1 GM12210 [Drosophila sechellia]EDX14916.1 GD17609 [Drosophila simulans]KMZ06695.1 uncharacterized protein Dsimw501_GD17609, isoform A [Drosophila simulans]